MHELPAISVAFAAGALLGGFFFCGLWWTVSKGTFSQRAGLWFLGSMALRMGIALAGFHLCAGNDWRRLAACLLGFILARALVLRMASPPRKGLSKDREVRHAP